jgi:hypothetical protein
MRTRPVLVLAALAATLIGIAVYVSRGPACETGGRSAKGDVKREADGRLMYFDGQCWTTKSLPPQDTPF